MPPTLPRSCFVFDLTSITFSKKFRCTAKMMNQAIFDRFCDQKLRVQGYRPNIKLISNRYYVLRKVYYNLQTCILFTLGSQYSKFYNTGNPYFGSLLTIFNQTPIMKFGPNVDFIPSYTLPDYSRSFGQRQINPDIPFQQYF